MIFRDLLQVLTAWEPGEVLERIAEIEGEVAKGHHAAGFLSYEAAPAMEPAIDAAERIPGLPLLWFGIFRERTEGDALTDLPGDSPGYRIGDLTPSVTREEYERRAREILDLIAAGDTYQVNYTFRLRADFEGSDTAFYRDICRAQRSNYCAYLPLGRYAILSASPELFFHRTGEHLRMRPMKGTRPRGRWAAEDEQLASDLIGSAKDRAENLMIVDLLRNDLGRVAEFGSVEVSKLFEVERYPTVQQLTSTVEGRLRAETTLADLFRALFPSGSVSGAPKIRTCGIIRELESTPRGVYTGAIGFVSPGEAVFSVAIRTAVLDLQRGELEVGVGSGITADSDPLAEYEECLSKGAFLRYALPDFHLLESLRLEVPGGYEMLEGHLDRLTSTARYFSYPLDRSAASAELERVAEGLRPGIYKVRLLVGSSGALSVRCEAIPNRLPPARVGLASHPVDERDPFLFHKTTHRPMYENALAAAPAFDDVILFNRRGELTESATANIVLKIDGELLTPPVTSGLLAGVRRGELLRRGEIREHVLRKEDLRRASRIHLVNSVRGWRDAILA